MAERADGECRDSRRRFLRRAFVAIGSLQGFCACGGGTDAAVASAAELSSDSLPTALASPSNADVPVLPPGPAPLAAQAPPPGVVAPKPAGPLPAPVALKGPLPSWVPSPGSVTVMTQTNGLLTNSFRSTVAPYYSDYYSAETVNAYSGSVVNPYHGTYGVIVFEGGGHAGSNDNSVHVLDLQADGASFRRVTSPTPLFGSGTDADTRYANSYGGDVMPLTDFTWTEYTVDGQPTSRHSYGAQDVIGPEHGGAVHGTLMRVLTGAGAAHGMANGEVPHKVDFNTTAGLLKWERAGSRPGVSGLPSANPAVSFHLGGPNWTAHVAHQSRIYIECNGQGGTMAPRWFDLGTRTYVMGTGLARANNPDLADGGIMFHVEWRRMLVHADAKGGNLRLRYMNVDVDQPSWVETPRDLSRSIPVAGTWSAACWCPDNGRIIVGNVQGDDAAVYEIEIPSDVDQVWNVTRVPLPAGQRIRWAPSTTYKKWSYNPYVRAIVYMPYAARASGDDEVYVYRPRGT